ncbi:hypothetical protein K492DRAFT_189234 [Lichtheimia hyalospora FSU 10163]|nr:hypothetical protein K492DRAFT_189234 [Lichtheimia hyalospora FSU 10163]
MTGRIHKTSQTSKKNSAVIITKSCSQVKIGSSMQSDHSATSSVHQQLQGTLRKQAYSLQQSPSPVPNRRRPSMRELSLMGANAALNGHHLHHQYHTDPEHYDYQVPTATMSYQQRYQQQSQQQPPSPH